MANDGLIHYNIVALNEMITCLDEMYGHHKPKTISWISQYRLFLAIY